MTLAANAPRPALPLPRSALTAVPILLASIVLSTVVLGMPEYHVKSCRGGDADCQAVARTIAKLHDAWSNEDADRYVELLTENVTRSSQLSGEIQRGRAAVRKRMPREWRAFERTSTIPMKTRIRNLRLTVDGDTAIATHETAVTGGRRWSFSDYALFFQVFVRSADGWKLAHQTDSWNLDLDDNPDFDPFKFDYVTPVADLSRAVQFYRPLLGEPEFVSDKRAQFNLGGARFILDTGDLHGHAKIKTGMPNGYAEVHVKDLQAAMTRLHWENVGFLTDVLERGPDHYVVAQDNSGNVFVLVERGFPVFETGTFVPPRIGAAQDIDPKIVAAVTDLMSSWLQTDTTRLKLQTVENVQWFDDTRSKTRGIGTGARSIHWDGYDRTRAGLNARMEIEDLQVKTIGSRQIVSYQMTLTGNGDHRFRERSMVTQVVTEKGVAYSFIVASYASRAHVLSLDYVAYPVTDLQASEEFYTRSMNFGSPYSDARWRGFWSGATVYGIYEASLADDGLPRPGRTNGYASFWVRSAEETYTLLQQKRASFPVIDAITSTSGIDRNAGYVQIYATDSEGNGVVFTEYPRQSDLAAQ